MSSCVLNNGNASKHFLLAGGVGPGCPLSGLLFVIGIELLAQSIRRSNKIHGIIIQQKEEIKLAQYADDTKAFLADTWSAFYHLDLLSVFEKCSGLKINHGKSELLWLGSMRQRKNSFLKLQFRDEPIYALGVHFSNDQETTNNIFF